MDVAADFRWIGPHGIGRFAREVLKRLGGVRPAELGIGLLHPLDPLAQSIWLVRNRPQVYFNPGFTPPLYNPVPLVFVIHDLIHMRFARESSWSKRAYYSAVVRPASHRSFKVLTVSEFSRGEILEWSGLPEEHVVVVGNGVGAEFSPEGPKYKPGFPYLLCIGSPKPHKNLERMLAAYASSGLPGDVGLICTGRLSAEQRKLVHELRIDSHVRFVGVVPDERLPDYYRGALALIFPSLYEGFGLPPLEAMASGTPVVASAATSIPEVVGDAALLIDPYDLEDMAQAIYRIASDSHLRRMLAGKGLERARRFSWEQTARRVERVLREAAR